MWPLYMSYVEQTLCDGGTTHCIHYQWKPTKNSSIAITRYLCAVSPPHWNQSIWRLVVSITIAHSLQNGRLTRMWLRSLHTSPCGAIKKPSCYHTWKSWHHWRNAVVGLMKESQLPSESPHVKWSVHPNYKKNTWSHLWCQAVQIGWVRFWDMGFLPLPREWRWIEINLWVEK